MGFAAYYKTKLENTNSTMMQFKQIIVLKVMKKEKTAIGGSYEWFVKCWRTMDEKNADKHHELKALWRFENQYQKIGQVLQKCSLLKRSPLMESIADKRQCLWQLNEISCVVWNWNMGIQRVTDRENGGHVEKLWSKMAKWLESGLKWHDSSPLL